MKLIDLTGERFGRLTVIKRVENDKSFGSKWLCKCDCGNECVVFSNNLRRGNTTSCGCVAIESRTTHNKWGTKVYRTYDHMKQRCYNPNSNGYKYWGGRGIKICDEWLNSFDAFYNYVSKLPHYGEEGRSIDRINNDGDYEPNNVRWATKSEQNANKRHRAD